MKDAHSGIVHRLPYLYLRFGIALIPKVLFQVFQTLIQNPAIDAFPGQDGQKPAQLVFVDFKSIHNDLHFPEIGYRQRQVHRICRRIERFRYLRNRSKKALFNELLSQIIQAGIQKAAVIALPNPEAELSQHLFRIGRGDAGGVQRTNNGKRAGLHVKYYIHLPIVFIGLRPCLQLCLKIASFL
jgi:hypothetical protein